jgi:hypothetical protein
MMKSRFIILLATTVAIISVCTGCSPSFDRHPIADYPRTDQPIESVVQDPNDEFSTVTMHFSTPDAPEIVRQFYEEALRDDKWDVELIPVAGVQPLPTPSTPDNLLVHGGDVRGCPMHYVDVVIEPREEYGSDVTITVGSVLCY